MLHDERQICWSRRCLVNVCSSTGHWEAVLQSTVEERVQVLDTLWIYGEYRYNRMAFCKLCGFPLSINIWPCYIVRCCVPQRMRHGWATTTPVASWILTSIFFLRLVSGLTRKKRLLCIYTYIYIYIFIFQLDRVWWSRGSVLAFSTQVCRFKPGRSRWIFRAKKSSARLPSEGK